MCATLSHAGFGGAIDNAAITEFVDDGNSVLIAVDSEVSGELRLLVSELGIDLEPQGHAVMDHFNHGGPDSDHATITADTYVQSTGVWGESQPQVRPMLTANETVLDIRVWRQVAAMTVLSMNMCRCVCRRQCSSGESVCPSRQSPSW